MKPTRRLFLQSAALSALATGLPLSAFARELLNTGTKGFDPEVLAIFDGVSAQTFEPWIGSKFGVSLNNLHQGSLVLQSVKEAEAEAGANAELAAGPYLESTFRRVSPLPGTSNAPPMTSFSLQFQRTGSPLRQETYMLSHDWLGTFPLLLVPSGLAGTPSTCTATFTLLKPLRISTQK
jgi:hypothetical protein